MTTLPDEIAAAWGLGCLRSQAQVAARARRLGIADYDGESASKSGDRDDDVFVLKIG